MTQLPDAAAESPGMRALRPRAIARRLVVVVPFGLLAAGVTFALGGSPVSAPSPTRATAAARPAVPIVVVPDLRQQAYVFARGILLDGGFAWTVDGAIQGYASNLVVRQSPAPGTRLVDTGAPTIRLQRAPNPQAPESGDTIPGSPYSGTEVLTPAAAAAAARKQAAEEKRLERVAARAEAASRAAATRRAEAAARGFWAGAVGPPYRARAAETAIASLQQAVPTEWGASRAAVVSRAGAAAKQARAVKNAAAAKQARVAKQAATAKQAAAAKRAAAAKKAAAAQQAAAAKQDRAAKPRPAAFAAAGAPPEPMNELPLPDRARLLARWIAGRPSPTPANRHHFGYQHAWVVTGARFGWWHGDEALTVLIAADLQLERQWRLAPSARAEAEAALADVRRRSAG